MEESINKITVSLVLEGEQGIREGNHTGVNVQCDRFYWRQEDTQGESGQEG